jgi:hypothetical protein
MLIDGFTLSNAAVATNFSVDHGTTLATTGNNVGELFYKTGAGEGLYIYNGTDWVFSGSDSAVTAHLTDYTLHLTSSQNTLLDGLNVTLTATKLNYVDGVTSDIQTQLDSKVTANGGSAALLTSFPTFNQNTTGSAATLTTGRTISVTGDGTGTSAAFNGSANASIALTLADTTVTPGSYGSATSAGSFTVDSKGRLTAASSTSIAIPTSAITSGTFSDARIASSNVTQHQAALTILESQITDGTLLARIAANETISGTWTFSNPIVGSAASLTSFPTFNQNTAGSAATLTTGRTISVTGDGTGTSGSFDGSANASIALTLGTVNGAPQTDTFRKITVNGKGLTTGTSAVLASDINASLGYTPLNKAGDTMSGLLILSADPVNVFGAATKQYVDNVQAGVTIHNPCATATSAPLASATYSNGAAGVGATLTATSNGAIGTVGGYASLAVGSRVLVKDQASGLQNGVYDVTALGSAGAPWVLTRSSDFDGSPTYEVVSGDLIYIQNGTLSGTQFVQTAVGTGSSVSPAYSYIIIGTDALVFGQFAGSGTYTAGSGIAINTNVISLTSNSLTIGSTNIALGGTSTTLAGLTSVSTGTLTATGAITSVANPGTSQTAFTSTTSGTGYNVLTLNNAAGQFLIGLDSSAGTPLGTGIAYGGTLISPTTFTLQVSNAKIAQFTPGGLDVTGSVSGTSFTGAGTGLTGTAPALTVGSASSASTVTNASQPSITSVGTLTSLAVSGLITVGNRLSVGGSSTIDTAGDIRVRRSASTGALYFGDGASSFLYFDGTDYRFGNNGSSTSIIVTGQIVGASFSGAGTGLTGTAASLTAGTVTNGVYTTGNQTVSGLKTFTSIVNASVSSGASFNAESAATGTSIITLGNVTNGERTRVTSTNARSFIISNDGGTTAHLTLDASGNLTASGNVGAFSDERVKTNWQALPSNFLEMLSEVKSGTYDRRDIVAHQVGVSAQSLQAVLPEAVNSNEEGFLSVNYGQAALVAAIELAKEVRMLRAEIAALKGL